ncbi:sphingomyelin phosphodiesterase isoform X1 [Tribolium castaneum]|uniref:sphingomyelin phosphodiesterase isoform X1 n=1 Tax=Tribolium castaneum TaxID=7070 RepID=UPI0030FF1E24
MALLSLIYLLVFVSFTSPIDIETPEGLELVAEGLNEFFTTGREPDYLRETLQNNQLRNIFRDNVVENEDVNSKTCFFCHVIVNLLIEQRRLNASRELLATEGGYLCVNLAVENERVCKGAIERHIDILLYIVDNTPDLDSTRVCGSVLQSIGCPSGNNFNWSIQLPSGGSPFTPKSYDKKQSFKILHLSDFHFDPDYTPGGNEDCGEPICCQSDQGKPNSSETTCGYWSSYKEADTSWKLVKETVKQINTHQFDYLYYTGDIISHRVWETSIKRNTKSLSKIYSYMKKKFNVPVFPVLGNHEPYPLDQWPPLDVQDERISNRWLFELVAKLWSPLVGEDISETVLKGGYYTVSPRTGFRIIAINSNPCYSYNWWLVLNDVDPYGQLQWLADTLLEAEKNDERVHILSHVPSGTSECLSVWAREYSKIVERFANTIAGQFVGHTHQDEFYVYYNCSDDTQAVGAAFNGAAVTPWIESNPSYKIFDVDSKSFNLLDYEEWTFNLTLANSQPSAPLEWYKLYRFTEAYGVDNLSPTEVDKLLYKMAENHALLDDYYKYRYRNGDPGVEKGCDDSCKKKSLCKIATTITGDDTQCRRFTELYDRGQ